MANDAVLIANPTPVNITVNSQTVNAGRVALLTVSDATTDLYNFVAQGCVVSTASLTNGTHNVSSTVLDGLSTLVESGIQLLGATARAALSAGSDEWGQGGL
jgi:hypothetical protein